ncbi:hypothetical protein FJU08_11065 [Martelella alba]|uniref:Uncharacterized protein n=1 Tax=Martelella alba TaxID=2590451 RepID=A0A506UAF6_9HYPH|nr:hypothetical protein [Martelella alba]TPW30508.1 hypothetical protein FJU08_11065 [Martelella alba]
MAENPVAGKTCAFFGPIGELIKAKAEKRVSVSNLGDNVLFCDFLPQLNFCQVRLSAFLFDV